MNFDPMNTKSNPTTDYSTLIKEKIASGAPATEIANLVQERNNKIANDPSLWQYAHDSVNQDALDYIGKAGDNGNGVVEGTSSDLPGGDKEKTLGSSSGSGNNILVTPDNSLIDQSDALAAALKQSKINALKSAYDTNTGNLTKTFNTNMSDLDKTQSGIGSAYYDKRNQAAAASDIGAMNFAQYMAARGVKGSAGGMPEIYRNAALSSNINALNTAEAQDNANIDSQKTLLNNNYRTDLDTLSNAYTSDVAAAGADVDAQALQNKIDLLKDAASKQAATTAADKQSWLDTIGRFATQDGGYQAEIDRINAAVTAGNSSESWKIPYLEAARADKLKSQEQQEQQTFLDTIGQYAGKYNAEADRLAGDGDTSNDWKIAYLRAAAAQEAAKNNSTVAGGGSGSGSGNGSSTSFSRINADLEDMYNVAMADGKMTDAERQNMYSYAKTYGGQYGDQLVAKYGLSGSSGSTGSNYNSVFSMASSMQANGSSNDEVSDYISDKLERGLISPNDAAAIAMALGLGL